MKLSDLNIIVEQPIVTGTPMGQDPVKEIDAAIKQKEEQRRALDKEIADLRAAKPQAMKAVQQQRAQQTQQQPQQQQTASTMPTSNSTDRTSARTQIQNMSAAINAMSS